MYFVLCRHKTLCSATFMFLIKRVMVSWICKIKINLLFSKSFYTCFVHTNEGLTAKLSGSQSQNSLRTRLTLKITKIKSLPQVHKPSCQQAMGRMHILGLLISHVLIKLCIRIYFHVSLPRKCGNIFLIVYENSMRLTFTYIYIHITST